jgi:hypothetical protein
MKVTFAICSAWITLGAVCSVHGQFSPAFLQNASYWDEGKAEVDLYDAQVLSDGQLRPCEITMTLSSEKVTPPGISADKSAPHQVPAIVMAKMFTAPTGLSARQEASALSFGRDGRLLTACLAQSGLSGINYTQIDSAPQNTSFSFSHYDGRGPASRAQFADSTAAGSDPFASPHATVSAPPTSHPERTLFLYEELPLRVRTIPFTKPTDGFPIKMTAALSHWTGAAETADATISYKASEHGIEVLLKKGNETDRFLLDPEFPFLLREWQMADGSRLKLKNSLRVDYRQYLKNGDREKALKDPMLRHPD